MLELVKYFNEKYGLEYGNIDYPKTTKEIYQTYQVIKAYGIKDDELMKLINEIVLPIPKTTKEREMYSECLYEVSKGMGLSNFENDNININQIRGFAEDYANFRGLNIIEGESVYELDKNNYNDSSIVINENKYINDWNNKYHNNVVIIDNSFSSVFLTGDYMYAIVINNNITFFTYIGDKNYLGVNIFANTEFSESFHSLYFINKKIALYYPNIQRFYQNLPNTGYSMHTQTTYNPNIDSLYMSLAYKDKKEYFNIDNVKIFRFKYQKNDFTKTFINESINYNNLIYDYNYKLKFSAQVKLYSPLSSYSKAFKFFQPTNCIIDWGDGIIEKYLAVKQINHVYENLGIYTINIYSDNYLYISGISFGGTNEIFINKIDLSKHTVFLTNDCSKITFNCDVVLNNITNIDWGFDRIANINNFVFNGLNIKSLEDTFCGNVWLDEIPSFIKTSLSPITNFNYAFQGMTNLQYVTDLDVSTATTSKGMFLDCCILKEVNKLNFCNCNILSSCFTACHNLIEVKLKNTNKVTTFDYSFFDCVKLESVNELDITSLNIDNPKVNDDGSLYYKNIDGIFGNCWNLRYVKLVGEATAEKINIFIQQLPTYEIEGVTKQLDISECTNKDSVTATVDTWTIVK